VSVFKKKKNTSKTAPSFIFLKDLFIYFRKSESVRQGGAEGEGEGDLEPNLRAERGAGPGGWIPGGRIPPEITT